MKFNKFLYVDKAIDEKASAVMLENATDKSQYNCAFTVVSNLFLALECTEHTHYSAIFVAVKDDDNLNTSDFQKILRRVGAKTPIIRILDKFESVPGYVFEERDDQPPVRVLTKPFTDRQLCEAITGALQASETAEEDKMHLQNARFIGYHNLDCDSSFNELDDPFLSLLFSPVDRSSSKVGIATELLDSTVVDHELKRQRTSSSSASSSSSYEPRKLLNEFSGKESSSSSNSVSIDFDPDTVFQDEA